jgi:hypothetical protein
MGAFGRLSSVGDEQVASREILKVTTSEHEVSGWEPLDSTGRDELLEGDAFS